MESLIDLSIFEYEIWISDTENIIHIEIYLDTRLILNKLQNGHSTCRNIYQCALSRYFTYNLAAHFDKLMMIMCQRIKKYRSNIYIRLFCVPWTIVTASEPRY